MRRYTCYIIVLNRYSAEWTKDICSEDSIKWYVEEA